MPAIFIHGVADTYRLWDDVRAQLAHVDSIALALPGFDVAVPAGFNADKEGYVEWIIGEIEKSATPVDIVGHDWGCMFALRVASLRPDLIRTVTAGNGPISQEYEWHRLAKVWQTRGEGEKFMSELNARTLSELLQSLGVPSEAATRAAGRVDDRMKECILTLYRSAVNVGAEWQGDLSRVKCPATIFWGRRDTECPVRFAYEMAERLPLARVAELDCGHWVPLQRARELAEILKSQWNAVNAKVSSS